MKLNKNIILFTSKDIKTNGLLDVNNIISIPGVRTKIKRPSSGTYYFIKTEEPKPGPKILINYWKKTLR